MNELIATIGIGIILFVCLYIYHTIKGWIEDIRDFKRFEKHIDEMNQEYNERMKKALQLVFENFFSDNPKHSNHESA